MPVNKSWYSLRTSALQTVVPPYIDDNAPPAKRGLWLSIFYMAIPVGTAIGCVCWFPCGLRLPKIAGPVNA
jgi:hypothetical protein